MLTVVHRAAAGGSTLQYGISAEARDDVAGMHCLEVTVDVAAQGALDFGERHGHRAGAARAGRRLRCRWSCARRAATLASSAGAVAGDGRRARSSCSSACPARPMRACRSSCIIQAPMADVRPCVPEARFAVTATRAPSSSSPPVPVAGPEGRASWLEQLPEGGVRQLFEHLAAHGIVTESEAAAHAGRSRAASGVSPWSSRRCVKKAPWRRAHRCGGGREAIRSRRVGTHEHADQSRSSSTSSNRCARASCPSGASRRSPSASRSSAARSTASSSWPRQARARSSSCAAATAAARRSWRGSPLLDAQARGFATSFVVVSDNDLRFHRFDDVYRKVMTELGTASCPRGALGDILDRWIGTGRADAWSRLGRTTARPTSTRRCASGWTRTWRR